MRKKPWPRGLPRCYPSGNTIPEHIAEQFRKEKERIRRSARNHI